MIVIVIVIMAGTAIIGTVLLRGTVDRIGTAMVGIVVLRGTVVMIGTAMIGIENWIGRDATVRTVRTDATVIGLALALVVRGRAMFADVIVAGTDAARPAPKAVATIVASDRALAAVIETRRDGETERLERL